MRLGALFFSGGAPGGGRPDLRGVARSLLTLEINTIIKSNMTAEPMPPAPHALLDLAGEYAQAMARMGVDVLATRALLLRGGGDPAARITHARALAVIWRAPDAPAALDNDLLSVDAATFDWLRWTAKNAALSEAPEAAALSASQRVLLARICNNCDAIKGILERQDEGFARVAGRNRRALASMRLQDADLGMAIGDLILLRKMWEVGTEEVMAQTVVNLDGDVLTRLREDLHGPRAEMLLQVHRLGIDISVSSWRYLVDTVVALAGMAMGRLLGRR